MLILTTFQSPSKKSFSLLLFLLLGLALHHQPLALLAGGILFLFENRIRRPHLGRLGGVGAGRAVKGIAGAGKDRGGLGNGRGPLAGGGGLGRRNVRPSSSSLLGLAALLGLGLAPQKGGLASLLGELQRLLFLFARRHKLGMAGAAQFSVAILELIVRLGLLEISQGARVLALELANILEGGRLSIRHDVT